MNISYKWLHEWIDLTGVTPEEIADKLTNAGIEVDDVISLNKGVSNVVVGKVLSVEQHPDADKLRVCRVDVAEQEPLQIVCGAPNVAAGQLVPVAKIGAVLPGNFKIKKSKLRGVESQGMICSGQELGLDQKYLPKELQSGIYVFSEDYSLGTDVCQVFNLDDSILDLDLTPNRSDCLSIRGVAYEMAALLDRPLKQQAYELQEMVQPKADTIAIKVEDQGLCPRYAARLVKNVTVAPSPMWLRNKLQAAGIRSINNIVDVTNLILIEYGQPLHAFDYDMINDKSIIVRPALDGEVIKTLDEAERTLTTEMLVIADSKEAIAIAGVMGGWNSEVTDNTSNVLIESAQFNSMSVRKTSSALGLRSEASTRFEKGIDPNVTIAALNRATQLIAELGGGEIVAGVSDSNPGETRAKEIATSANNINNRLGTDLSEEMIIGLFERLQFQVTVNPSNQPESANELLVRVPTRRSDLLIEEDLSEEIARLYGYSNIPTTLPIGQSTQGKLTKEQEARRRVRDLMLSTGWNEAVSYTLVNPQQNLALGLTEDRYQQMISLRMPLSEDHSSLRTSMLPSMLELAEYNNNHKNDSLRLFEIGKVFYPKALPLTELPEEKMMIAGITYGGTADNHWSSKMTEVDFYYVKGVIEHLFNHFGISHHDAVYTQATKPAMHPGQTAVIAIAGEEIGYIGQLHPQVLKQANLPKTYYFEIDYKKFLDHAKLPIQYSSLPKYPSIKRDIALVIDQQVAARDIVDVIKQNGGELLTAIQLFDVYIGKGVEDGKKSLAFSLTFQANDRTLTDEEIQTVIQAIISKLEGQWNAVLRS